VSARVTRWAAGREAGATLIETIAAIAILGIASAIALGAMGSALPQAFRAEAPISAVQLARDLMEETLSKRFNDPASPDGELLGGDGSRAAWDDVDDYGGFAESPPRDPEGALIPGASRFARRVVVTPILGNMGGVQNVTTRALANFLRVDVYVSQDGEDVVRLSGLRTNTDLIVPAPRSGLVYLAGTRTDNAGGGGGGGGGESTSFDLKNQSSAPIQVTQVRVFWTPATAVFFRDFSIQVGAATASYASSGTYASSGQLLTLSQPLTIGAGVTAPVDIEHFRSNVNGTGPAFHPAPLAFTLIWTSGSRTIQTDIPVSN